MKGSGMQKKLNILFVNPPSIPFKHLKQSFSGKSTHYQTITPPLGILYLSSAVKNNVPEVIGSVGILDYVLETKRIEKYSSVDEFIESLPKKINFVPDVIAYSVVFSSSHYFFEASLNHLKSLWPDSKVVVGGNSATNTLPELLENIHVDYVVRGEGENAFTDILTQMSQNKPIEVQGVYSRENYEKGMALKIPVPITSMDLPFPDFSLLEFDEYLLDPGMRRNHAISENQKGAVIMTSRGCAYSCTFCASHTVHGRAMRYRSIENVAAEVLWLHQKYGAIVFVILDDLFTVHKTRTVELLDTLKKLNIPNFELQFPNALAVNTLNEAVMDALIDAGMTTANIAVESGSTEVQNKIIRKNVNLPKAKEVVKYFNDRNITTRANFIMGYPGETLEQMRETIAFASELGADWNNMGIVAPLKGTVMYDQFVEEGAIQDTKDVWADSYFTERTFDTSVISAEEIKELSYRANLEVNFINNRSFISGDYEKAIRVYYDVIKLYPFQIVGWYCIMLCYEKMNDAENASKMREKMDHLMKTDERAVEIYQKYSDLMPEYTPLEAFGVPPFQIKESFSYTNELNS